MCEQMIDGLNVFPTIAALGARRIQELCDDWLSTPLARECAITTIRIVQRDDKVLLDFSVQLVYDSQRPLLKDGEEIHFPFDDLLHFIADNGISDKDTRQVLKQQILDARRRGGVKIYQRFRVTCGPRKPLCLDCKTDGCGNKMQTQYSIGKHEEIFPWTGEATCPRCGMTYEYTQDDLYPIPE